MPTPAPRVSLRERKVTLAAISVFLLCLLVAASIVVYQQHQPAVEKINYSQLYALSGLSGVTALTVEGDTLTLTKQDGTLVEAVVSGEAAQHEIIELFRKNNVPVEFRVLRPGLIITILNWGLPLLCLGFVGFAGWKVYASINGGGSFDLENQSGKLPAMNAIEVISNGRRRKRAPSNAASNKSRPFSNSVLANSTIRIAFFAASPITTMRPICE